MCIRDRLSTASVIRLTVTGAQTITGIAGGSSGRILYLNVVSGNTLTLALASGSSSAANRFDDGGNGGSITIIPGDIVVLQYDSTTSRWRIQARYGYNANLRAFSTYSTNGLFTQTAANTFTGRTVTGTTNEVSVSNGDGVSGNPTLSLPSTLALRGKTVQVQDN